MDKTVGWIVFHDESVWILYCVYITATILPYSWHAIRLCSFIESERIVLILSISKFLECRFPFSLSTFGNGSTIVSCPKYYFKIDGFFFFFFTSTNCHSFLAFGVSYLWSAQNTMQENLAVAFCNELWIKFIEVGRRRSRFLRITIWV